MRKPTELSPTLAFAIRVVPSAEMSARLDARDERVAGNLVRLSGWRPVGLPPDEQRALRIDGAGDRPFERAGGDRVVVETVTTQ